MIQSESAKKMSSYNPIFVDYALRKAIGSYEFCKPMQNGRIMVKCSNASQIKTLLNLTEIFDALGNKIPIITSVMSPPGAKGVIRNVPLMLSKADILAILKPHQVKFVNRFKIKSTNEMQNSTTVLLRFISPSLPNTVNIGLGRLKLRFMYPSPCGASNAIVSGMLH